MQHPWRNPLPISTLLVSPWSSLTLTFWSLVQSHFDLFDFPIVLSNSISLLQLTLSNAFFQSVKHTQMSSFTSRHLSDNIPQYSYRLPSSSIYFKPELVLFYVLVYLVFESSVLFGIHTGYLPEMRRSLLQFI
uniref:Putative product n=1 Tax=Xenopsylla cheopis TaxID=163159 RepID=A0A6M2DZF5_XENCH